MATTGGIKPDEAGAVRKGEELDTAAVDAWLKPRVPDLSGMPRVTQYSGGASNWTYRLEYESHDLVLRRPPAGTKAKSAHDMGREYNVQKALRPVFPYVPEMIAYCDDVSVIGAPFYVMSRIPGIIPRARLPEGLTLDSPDGTHALPEPHRQARRAAQGRRGQGGPLEHGEGAGLREAADRGLERAIREGAHLERAWLQKSAGLAQGEHARMTSPRASSTTTSVSTTSSSTPRTRRASSASWTGRWPRSATR